MAAASFIGQRMPMSRDEAVERYILLRLRAEDLRRLAFLVEGLYAKNIKLPSDSPFTHADLKDAVRTAFFGCLATLTDRDGRAVYAFDPLFALFPDRRTRIIKVQVECEACHGPLQRFRNNVAAHTRAEVAAHIQARQALREEDTFLELESARTDFVGLMEILVAEELRAIPELPGKLAEHGVSRHPAFANVPSASSCELGPYYSCSILD